MKIRTSAPDAGDAPAKDEPCAVCGGKSCYRIWLNTLVCEKCLARWQDSEENGAEQKRRNEASREYYALPYQERVKLPPKSITPEQLEAEIKASGAAWEAAFRKWFERVRKVAA